ncbi:MAG: LL-diaminopimelate aminotransferase [Clostridiales bacterium]|jgi:LL-diaminopimelate aminotransferase|nr:LL-diaminopimelate aminotransferase [Clostridiales bacterium]
MILNKNYLNLQDSYLFVTIEQKVSAFQRTHPDARIIRLGIGDVTRPLAPAVVEAMKNAAAEMSAAKTFRGYRSDRGYEFLREAIGGYYAAKGVALDISEIFISDGAKSDAGNILDIFAAENRALIPDPVYPVYVDTNVMAGRDIFYLSGNESNGFLPLPDASQKADIIYLCSPNNPTGAVYDRAQLKNWVDYARENDAIILFDAAYEIFAGGANLPSSIYQIPGAEECAIEFCSFSKTAGFTGVRCGYTIVPLKLKRKVDGADIAVNDLWLRRQTTKFNGVSYITQRGAEAVFSQEGFRQVQENIAYYQENAKIIAAALTDLNIWFTGGEHSPYVWLKCPDDRPDKCPGDRSSWDFFDRLLTTAHVVGTPGAGFGASGEGYFRLSAFGERDDMIEAARRIKENINIW